MTPKERELAADLNRMHDPTYAGSLSFIWSAYRRYRNHRRRLRRSLRRARKREGFALIDEQT